jgi:hypothetical protein
VVATITAPRLQLESDTEIEQETLLVGEGPAAEGEAAEGDADAAGESGEQSSSEE